MKAAHTTSLTPGESQQLAQLSADARQAQESFWKVNQQIIDNAGNFPAELVEELAAAKHAMLLSSHNYWEFLASLRARLARQGLPFGHAPYLPPSYQPRDGDAQRQPASSRLPAE